MNDFLDNLANDQYRKMHKPKKRRAPTEEEWKEMDKEIEMMFGSEYESGIDYD